MVQAERNYLPVKSREMIYEQILIKVELDFSVFEGLDEDEINITNIDMEPILANREEIFPDLDIIKILYMNIHLMLISLKKIMKRCNNQNKYCLLSLI
ncbi:hypothetical protein ACERII_23985 [Evansella sp. AB-rgal1]|uniref:hypothetical protein n=1 Tax=Evansella sp. AB-rgal1 TaxID=3242696 RepID=UPI00359D2F44